MAMPPYTTHTSSLAERFADWVVGVFSPRRALSRQHFRRMARDTTYRESVFAALRARGYRAARDANGVSTPWLNAQSTGTADSHVLSDLPTLLARSRELNRDDPLASGLTETFANDVIGTGLRPQSLAGADDINRGVEAIWAERKDRLALADDLIQGEFQRLLIVKLLEDGSVGLKRVKRSPDDPLWFEVIEVDRIARPHGKTEPESGVERDSAGVPVAYWVRPAEGHSLDTVRVPAEEMRLLRLVGRPGQTKGVPLYHAILQDLRDIDLLLVASLKRTQVAACLSAFIKTTQQIPDIFDETSRKYGFVLDQPLEPGMIMQLFPDESMETLVPNFPTPELAPFIVMLARRVGAAVGVSWQIVLKDFSESTYSSARVDILEALKVFSRLRGLVVDGLLNWVWFSVLEDARLRGDPRAQAADADLAAVRWIANARRWIDPLKEARGAELELLMGLTTLRDLAAEHGRDWEDLLQQQAKEKQMREALGLVAPPPSAEPPEDDSGFTAKDIEDLEALRARWKNTSNGKNGTLVKK